MLNYLLNYIVDVDYEYSESRWRVLETNAPLELVKEYVEATYLGRIVLFNKTLNLLVEAEKIAVTEQEIKDKLADIKLRKERQKIEYEIRSYNQPFEDQIKLITRTSARELEEYKLSFNLYRSVPFGSVTEELIQKYDNEGYVKYDRKKGKQRFIRKDAEKIKEEFLRPKEVELNTLLNKKINELKKQMKKMPKWE